jgi:hypothetical protein
MEKFFLVLLVVHAVVVVGVFMSRALYAKLAPATTVVEHAPGRPDLHTALPAGRELDDYVQSGLDDLKILLVQAARRHRG